MPTSIQFLGAAGTVTGSKYLVTHNDTNILIDVGIFQGPREWRERNWDTPPIDLTKVDATLITHAHIDHIGMLPRYVRYGLQSKVYCTRATHELSQLLLIDSGKLQEEEAEYRLEHHRSRHNPPMPLYTEEDAKKSLKFLHGVPFNSRIEVAPGVFAEWKRMGHILGAASIKLEIGGKVINFSGDIGRYSVPILVDPEPVEYGDLLLIESTYGDREHSEIPPQKRLEDIINETVAREGVVVIPSFAVGRTQELLYHVRKLKNKDEIPDIPIVVDSPMGEGATRIYQKYHDCYDEEAKKLLNSGVKPFEPSKLYFTKSRDESIKLNSIHDPMIIISASGMLGGGRILHHLKHRIAEPRNTILFVGFQPPGGRGDWIKSGASSLTLLGDEIPIRAHIEEISGLSAHADRSELVQWAKSGKGKPGAVAIVHGEPQSAENFKNTLHKELGWNAFVAKYRQKFDI